MPNVCDESERLKEIFNLMFSKLASISIGDNFVREIDLRRKAKFDKNKPDSFFYEKLVETIHGANIKSSTVKKYWNGIAKSFLDFNVVAVSKFTGDNLAGMVKNPKLIRNEKKLRDCIENAKIMVEISKEYGSFGNYLDKYRNNSDNLAAILMNKFHFLGKILVFNYLKEVGIDAIKPDVRVCRVMYRLGLIDSLKDIDKVAAVAKEMAGVVGEKLNVIDAVFWMYGGSGDNHIQKAVCSKNKPLCDECPLTEYCVLYKAHKI